MNWQWSWTDSQRVLQNHLRIYGILLRNKTEHCRLPNVITWPRDQPRIGWFERPILKQFNSIQFNSIEVSAGWDFVFEIGTTAMKQFLWYVRRSLRVKLLSLLGKLITLSNMKGNFLMLLVTANTTYTAFDVVLHKIMLYTQQDLFNQSD